MDPDGEVVQGLGGVLPVEVASGHCLTPLSEHNRIVCSAVHFRGYNSLDKLYGVMGYAMHLWGAPQRVGILKHKSGIERQWEFTRLYYLYPVAKPVALCYL